MPALIRPATPADRDALIEQCLALNHYEDAISHDRATSREDAIDTLAVAEQHVAETGGVILVAERSSEVVGHLFLVFEQAGPYVRKEKRCYAHISELFVRADARGAGIGTALVREAERIAVRRGLNQLTISVLAGNHPAEALYRREGFSPQAIDLAKPIGP